MKYTTIIICLLCCQSLFSQNDKKWAVEMSNSIDYYFVDVENYDRFSTGGVTGFHLDKRKINYTLGISIIRKIDSNISIGLGMQYANRDFEGQCYCDVCDKIAILNEEISMEFVEIPVFAIFTLGNDSKKLRPFIKAGATASKVLNESFREEFRAINFNGSLGLGIQYKVNDSFQLNLGSNYEWMFQTISEFSEHNSENVSLQLGLQTHF